ncbi:SDR family oxidoreductase [Paraglaciecola arctica]|uniref:3-oxoacyl-[acyl-carrier-protein] reductase n=1 Tax=Paraglaciecola arctica BSs20135 TaxID=493475 RepID=K6Z6J3_9ALTE|nr:SDR family oxidoreductase [Paraglaciecola arctica]GAC19065.1 3-oxoacyl-[acyl-carrier-protein] reductase [Paraglaciecola arctica BSs20135]
MLKGKRVIVTGSARGLGLAFAMSLVEKGAHIVIADILEDEGSALANSLQKSGYNAHFVKVDLANPKSIEKCVLQSVEILGGLDGLVNNGAIATGIGGVSMEDIDIDVWDKVMNVNVRGTWLMTRAASPFLRQSGNAKVVNMASDTALWGAPKLLHYVSSKGAIIAMTKSMARELGNDNVCVNAIAPGLTLVEATEYVPEERHQQYRDGRAISRAQLPEDVVGVVNFLLSDSASFITGQLLPINGGFVMN